MGSIFGGGGGGTEIVETRSTTELPEWVEREGEQLYQTAQPIAEREYPFYDFSRIAGFNPDQLASFDLARSQVGAWQPSFTNAFFGYGAAGDQFNPWGAPAYASPYQMAIAGPAEQFAGPAGEFAFQSGTAGTPYAFPGFAQAFLEGGTGRGTEAAYGALGAGAAPLGAADIERYFNPYVQDVQQTAITELNRQYERDRNARNAEMVSRGSYLNEDRREVIDNLSRESRDRVIAEMVARTNADAFNTALGAAQGDRARALSAAPQYRGLAGDVSGRSIQALATSMGVRAEDLSRMLQAGGQFTNLAQLGAQIGSGGLDAALGTRSDDLSRLLSASGGFAQLAPQAQQMGYADVAAMLGIGGQQQGQEQNELDLGYSEFLRQFNHPQEQLNWLLGMLRGGPYATTSINQQPIGTSNPLGGLLGGAASITGMLGPMGFNVLGCWVAREVFGEADPRWLIFREWMFTRAPKWLLAAYLKYGERVARWLRSKPRVKAMVRSWMDSKVQEMSRA